MVTVAALLTALAITFNPVYGKPHQPRLTNNRPGALSHAEAVVIRAKMCAYALKHNTKPAYVMAVGHIESRKGKWEFRTWKTGLYFQPMGIHEYALYERGWPVDTLDGNLDTGARALRNIGSLAALKKRLRSYNRSFTASYWNEVLKAVDKYETKGISG